MGKSAKERKDAKFKLKQPDRSGPDPSRQTLLDLAEQRGLLNAQPGEKVDDEETGEAESVADRILESILWSLSLTMLHFTLDVLVSHQYAVEIEWPSIMMRAAQAYPSACFSISSFEYLLTDIQLCSFCSTPSTHIPRPHSSSRPSHRGYSLFSTSYSSL